jgi:hypothetical protein
MLAVVDEQPFFAVVRGTPTAEELAALVGALVQRSRATAAPAAPVDRSRWRDSGLPRSAPRPGPGAWRASVLPR